MSDSVKLQFERGVFFYVLSLFVLVVIVALSFLIGFKIIPTECSVLIFILVIVLILLFMTTINNFKKLYYIGKKEK